MIPRHIESQSFISPAECRQRIREADVVVAHAGMGTILSALELGTPVLIMPRRAELGEHRNDHQLATARWFAETGKVSVAFDELDMARRLDEVEHSAQPIASASTPPTPSSAPCGPFIDTRPA